jgi:thiol-disulfide isomerase/thioredoxin
MVQFSGQLENLPDGPFELDFFRDYINNDRQIVELPVKDDGSFAVTFEVSGPVMGTLTLGRSRMPVYLERGYTLHLQGDAGQTATQMDFFGEGSAENNFLVVYRREIESQLTGSLMQNAAQDMSPNDFIHFVDSLELLKMDFFKEHVAHRLSGENFKNFFETTVQYEKYQQLLAYPALHQRLNHQDALPPLPVDYYDFLEEALSFNRQPFSNMTYVDFLLEFLNHKKEAEGLDSDEMSRHEANYILAGEYLSDLPKYYIQALSVSREMNSGDMDIAMALYDDYMLHCPVDEYKQSLQSALAALESLWAGNPAPGFTMTDINGNEVSLGDYHGKVVYLKFWASWCGPCMRQVPPAAELKERFAGEDDLVFMYVSIDREDEAWRNAVAHHGITGVHMRTPGRERGVPALYNVRWIPTFYVIGRDGKIFDHRPPMPADEGIDEVIRMALAL